jgi:uncharacterized membrane protein
MSRWRLLAAAAVLAGYALLSHALMVDAPARSWTLAVWFGPLLLAMLVNAARRRHLPTLALCLLLAGILVAVARGGTVEDAGRLYLLQHAGIHAVLACTFGFTLRRGATPLITMLAERVHREFTPAMRDYTRRLTGWWVVYFVAMVVASVTLHALAPWSWWSLFANIVTPLSAALFFVGEFLLRRWRHPEFEPASLSQAIAAYRSRPAPSP